MDIFKWLWMVKYHYWPKIMISLNEFDAEELKMYYEKGISLDFAIEYKNMIDHINSVWHLPAKEEMIEYYNRIIDIENKYWIVYRHRTLEEAFTALDNFNNKPKNNKKTWYVYFIKDINWKVKIWKSKKPISRFKKYITENSEHIDVLHIIEYTEIDYWEAEKMRHKHFEDKNHNRERFNLETADIEYITSKEKNFIIK